MKFFLQIFETIPISHTQNKLRNKILHQHKQKTCTVQNNTQLRKVSDVVRQKVSIVGGVLVVLFAISRHEIEIHAWTTNATCKDAFEWEIEDLI